MKRLLSILGILALIALGFGLGAFYMRLAPAKLVLQQDAQVEGITDVSSRLIEGALEIPAIGEEKALFIFYPGGLVRPQAYEWLGVALSPLGVRTVIPIMPFDLAVFSANKADAHISSSVPTVIGGHSLGGAMAARYALTHPEIDGLVLMGAFSAASDDLSAQKLDTLVLAAEHDALATLEEVNAGMARLPAEAKLEIVGGAVHSFFGRYGPQANDGLPTVTRAAAERQIINALETFFESVGR